LVGRQIGANKICLLMIVLSKRQHAKLFFGVERQYGRQVDIQSMPAILIAPLSTAPILLYQLISAAKPLQSKTRLYLL
jgi:hypothetical protein